jgi:hypothetical protein
MIPAKSAGSFRPNAIAASATAITYPASNA